MRNCKAFRHIPLNNTKMKIQLNILLAIIVFISGCNQVIDKKKHNDVKSNNSIVGKWIRNGHTGLVSLTINNDGIVTIDFGNDKTSDVTSEYKLHNDTVIFLDKEGKMCQGKGKYKLYQTDYYISFDLIEDNCGGRIKTTMGFWVKPDYQNLITNLNKKISTFLKPELLLNRGRIYMAIGNTKQAKEDFDSYIQIDSLNARVWVNRAGTKFPYDMSGVVFDCNHAISLDSKNKNAYFLRGLAQYELGNKAEGCEDFTKAINLGFSVLKVAEKERCSEYWDKK